MHRNVWLQTDKSDTLTQHSPCRDGMKDRKMKIVRVLLNHFQQNFVCLKATWLVRSRNCRLYRLHGGKNTSAVNNSACMWRNYLRYHGIKEKYRLIDISPLFPGVWWVLNAIEANNIVVDIQTDKEYGETWVGSCMSFIHRWEVIIQWPYPSLGFKNLGIRSVTSSSLTVSFLPQGRHPSMTLAI